MVVDRLAKRSGIELSRRKFNAIYGDGQIEGRRIFLVQAQTYYYNETGSSVSSALGFFKIPPERLIVVHDELDLDEGQIRLKRGGGDAGNRGIRSLIEAIGTQEFLRVRIGIGHPADGTNGIDYLLDRLSDSQLHSFDDLIERAANAVVAVIVRGPSRAMSLVNQRKLEKKS
jgi:PTH1 family peptidyl-tRNA hydrolase